MLTTRIKTYLLKNGIFDNVDELHCIHHHYKELKQTISFTNKSILDIGCGDGKFLILISLLEDPLFCLGLDLGSNEFLTFKHYINQLNIKNIELKQEDICDFYLDGMKFDIITANYSLHHIFPSTENLLKSENYKPVFTSLLNKIHSLLKLNGIFIIKEITGRNLSRYWSSFGNQVGLGGINWNTKHFPNEYIQMLKKANFKKIGLYYSMPYLIRKYRITIFKKFLTNPIVNFFLCTPYYIYARK